MNTKPCDVLEVMQYEPFPPFMKELTDTGSEKYMEVYKHAGLCYNWIENDVAVRLGTE